MAKSDWDVIVIGAGVLGTFHAYHSSQQGFRTLLLERTDVPRQASVRNFGMVIPSGMPNELWLNRARESASLYRQLATELSFPMQTGGTQYLATTATEEQVLREFAELGPKLGHVCQFLDAESTRKSNPCIKPEACRASLHFSEDLRFDPRGFLRTFLQSLAKHELCTFQANTVAIQAKREGTGCVVTTADGTRTGAEHVFVCTGSDFGTLFPQRFAVSGLIRCKLLMARTKPQTSLRLNNSLASGLSIRRYPSFRQCPSWPKLAAEAVHPELTDRGIHILFAQDNDGRIVLGDSHEYISTGDFDETLDGTTEALILNEAKRLVHLEDWTLAERWHGVYCLHPDRELYHETIDERIHIVTGIGSKGMTSSPGLAREMIANLK